MPPVNKTHELLKKISLLKGKITCDNFYIDLSQNLKTQESHLSEDLIQISYGERYTIDIGWYPEYNYSQGSFIVYVIEDCEWEEPLLKLKTRSFKELMPTIQKAINFLNIFMKENPNRPIKENAFDYTE